MRAHAAFDPIWKSGTKKRGSAYAWLADQLGIPARECHIGEFDVETCARVVQIIRAEMEKPQNERFAKNPDKAPTT